MSWRLGHQTLRLFSGIVWRSVDVKCSFLFPVSSANLIEYSDTFICYYFTLYVLIFGNAELLLNFICNCWLMISCSFKDRSIGWCHSASWSNFASMQQEAGTIFLTVFNFLVFNIKNINCEGESRRNVCMKHLMLNRLDTWGRFFLLVLIQNCERSDYSSSYYFNIMFVFNK